MKEARGDYRRGGLFLVVSTMIALLVASFLGAPLLALLSIGFFGLGGGLFLILMG